MDGTAIVKQLGTDEGNDLPDLDLLSFVRAEDAKQRAKQLNLGKTACSIFHKKASLFSKVLVVQIMVPSQGCQDFIIDHHHHGDMFERFCISISHCKEMPEHREDDDRTSHVRRCCSKPPCFGWGKESVAEICFVQLGKTSRPRGEKPRLSNMFAFAFADTDRKQGHNLGRNTWMEIAQKLVAVGVVSTVSSTNGFECCFALTMTMVATSAMVQPYAQPQARLHVLQIMFHGPWTRANNLAVKVKSSSSPKHFFGGNTLVSDLAKIHRKYCIFTAQW